MKVGVQQLSKAEVDELISKRIAPTLLQDKRLRFQRAMLATTIVWGGRYNGDIRCLWGLIPPTLLSEEAYLWLHVIEPVADCEFLFVRHSQKAVAKALERFPQIVGHCEVGEDRSIRWVKWLGGVFGEPHGQLVPFVIRKQNDKPN